MVPVLSQLRCLGKNRSFLIAFHLSVFPHRFLHQGSPQSYITCPHYLIRTSAGITFSLWCILPSLRKLQTESSSSSSFSAFHTGHGHMSHQHSELGRNALSFVDSHCVLCVTTLVHSEIARVSCHTTDKRESERARKLFNPPITIISHLKKKKKWQKILMKALFILEVIKSLVFFQKKIYLKITPQTKLKNEYSHQLTSHTR